MRLHNDLLFVKRLLCAGLNQMRRQDQLVARINDTRRRADTEMQGRGRYRGIWTGARTPLSGCSTLWISNGTWCTSGASVRKRIRAFCLKRSEARSRRKTSRSKTTHLTNDSARGRPGHIRPQAAISTVDKGTEPLSCSVLRGSLAKITGLRKPQT